MRPFFTLLILALMIASCRQPDAISPDTLTDTWAERSARRDYANFNIKRKGNELLVENFFEVSSTQPATATRTLIRLK